MLVANFTTVRPNLTTGTRTVEDFSKFLGSKPHRLGIMSRMNTHLTSSFLTEGLLNVFGVDAKNKFQPIASFVIEWEVDQEIIRRVQFATVPSSSGRYGAPVTFTFKEAFFGKYDTFRIEKSRQQALIVSNPLRRHDNAFEYQVQLITSNPDDFFDLSACQAGMSTRWISNAHPEMSEEGNVKAQSNMEVHRNYITRHRNDVLYSTDFETMEDVYITMGTESENGKGNGTSRVYKMLKKEQELLNTFLEARNNAHLFSKCNVTPDGKARNFDPATNRPKLMFLINKQIAA